MSRKSQKLGRKDKRAKREEKTKTRTSAFAIFLALATIAGGVAAALALLPRISCVPSDPVDPSNPFSASFTITNNNFIPLRQVQASFGIGHVVTAPAQPPANLVPTFESRHTKPEWKDHRLRMDESFTITPADLIELHPPARLSSADIAVAVSFKLWLLPVSNERIFRFRARQQSNGQFYWYSQPLD